MSTHRINPRDLEVGTRVELAEHPELDRRTAKKLSKEHLMKNPKAYSDGGDGGGGRVIVVLNQNVKALAPRKKKKPEPQQQGGGGPGWIPQNLRMWG
jgi:hypothetical protein